MSSILEALEKSERERNQENVPQYHNMQPPIESSRGFKWLLLLLLFIALAAGTYYVYKLYDEGRALFFDKPSTHEASKAVGGIKSEIKGSNAQNSSNVSVDVLPNRLSSSGEDRQSLAYSSLSDEEKSLLPNERINVVSVSQNRLRSFAMLGEKMYREGNTLGNGAILESIANDHILIRYNDHLIRKNVE